MAAKTLREASGTSTSSSLGEEVFELGHPLPPGLLYRRCDPAELPFALCSELEEAPELIGQERAVEALNFALRVRGKGYNVYALGASGSGRHETRFGRRRRALTRAVVRYF